MQMHVEQLPSVTGYGGKLIQHSFTRRSGGGSHLGIIFPGMGYTAQMPLLYYASRVLLTKGADVMAMEQVYAREKGFAECSPEEHQRGFALTQSRYGRRSPASGSTNASR